MRLQCTTDEVIAVICNSAAQTNATQADFVKVSEQKGVG
jgi:hypothetical protein